MDTVMKRGLERTFQQLGQSPSQTERDECENAERAVRKAIAASSDLATRSVRDFVQGSYADRTNVRQDSDVDIWVLCRNVSFDLSWKPPARAPRAQNCETAYCPSLSPASCG